MHIDSHQHFWRLDRADYGWLTPDLKPLYRDFLPEHLEPLLRAAGIQKTILVQAAPTLAETNFLLDLAERAEFIGGVVGWVDMVAPDCGRTIAELAQNPRLVGIRPMIQDIDDSDWMLQPALTPAFEALMTHDLTFEALVKPQHLSRLHRLLLRHPALRVVIDHAAKPAIADGETAIWAREMRHLADDTQAYCKLSGLLTEAGEHTDAATIQPYFELLLDCFGAGRLMWGSDWPVLLLASDYPGWHQMAMKFLQPLPDEQQQQIRGATAMKCYYPSGVPHGN